MYKFLILILFFVNTLFSSVLEDDLKVLNDLGLESSFLSEKSLLDTFDEYSSSYNISYYNNILRKSSLNAQIVKTEIKNTPYYSKLKNQEEIIDTIAEEITNAYFDLATYFIKIEDQNKLSDVLFTLEMSTDHVYNIKEEQLETIEDTSVIAPVETDIEIVKATFSIVTLLLSTNQYISN